MKKKQNTYLLLLLVITIWSIILYKAINTIYPNKKTTKTDTIHINFKPEPLKQQDTFGISVHQRDPFLGIVSSATKNVKRVRPLPVKKEEKPQIPIAFSGRITGKIPGEHIYFISINNRQYVMKVNDEIQQVKLVKGSAKAVRVHHNGQVKTIPVTQ